ncbi:restriction endonuclease subunit S [Trichococcus sp.]|uniref:restriction endonuclease subunit S n=1 Tax=Trichococcus sp. TaxID=1985464 RepID=UPI003C7D6E3B
MSSKKYKTPAIRFKGFTDNWEQRKLRDLAESFNYGLNASAIEFDGENKYIRITDIDDKSHKFIQSGLTTPNAELSNADDYLLKEGDILFARTGASVGKTYQYERLDGKVYYAGFLIRARIKSEFDTSFIFQNTLTERYKNFIKITSQRSGQPGVNAQEYANFSILVPTREEQVTLGDFFKQLDTAIALHQRQLDNYKELKKAMLQKIFNQELRFKDQDGNDYPDWDEKKMGEIAKIRTGYTPPRKDKNNFGGDIIWISVADMKTKYIYDTKEYLSEKDVREAKWIEADTLIMSFKLSVGVLAITKIKCMSNEAIANFKWKNDITNNEYMYAYLSSQDISTYGNNASQGISLNNESLRKIRVPVPCKEEQQKIAEFFTLLDKKVESVKKGVELFKEQKKVFMQQMFL